MGFDFFSAANLDKELLEEGEQFAPNFDKNGLICAIAQDIESKEILMQAYMNKEALELTLKSRLVHYFSRSRQKIWQKGEVSGEVQKLVKIYVDCDQDTLLLMVKQGGKGAACHTGHKSCFFREVEFSGNKIKLSTKDKKLFDPKDVY